LVFRQEFDSEQERSDCTQERRRRLLEKPTAHSLACRRFAPVLNRARFPQILVAAEPGYAIHVFSASLWLYYALNHPKTQRTQRDRVTKAELITNRISKNCKCAHI